MQPITPKWSAVSSVFAASTTRLGGFSEGAFASLNLGAHVGDNANAVNANRGRLVKHLNLPVSPLWLEQVHGCEILYVDTATENAIDKAGVNSEPPVADAVWTDQPDIVLAVMTADCLPVLLASHCGSVIAAIHAGWRGLAAGILQKSVAKLPVPSTGLSAWLGPAIGPKNFEVGNEVRDTFTAQNSDFCACFKPSLSDSDKCFADIFAIAEQCLNQAGVTKISSDRMCTFSDDHLFFSHRRDNGTSGRMATLIWRT